MRNNQKPKPISKSQKALQICKIIGIETREDLEMFKRQVKKENETTLKALERYFTELLED